MDILTNILPILTNRFYSIMILHFINNLVFTLQRAVVTPMSSMEALWRDYSSFEQGVNKQLAEKLIHDKTRDHMIARKVAKVIVF